MKTEDFDFRSDSGAMPTDPIELRGKRRDSGKMIVLDRSTVTIEHAVFSTIHDYFRPGDLLVLNDSYILSNTLSFWHAGKAAEVIVYGHEPDGSSIVEVRSEKQLSPGHILASKDDDKLTCIVLESQPGGLWQAKFEPAERLVPALDQYGRRTDKTIPLNPAAWKTEPEAYRSVYAKTPGSLEIPSAGLH